MPGADLLQVSIGAETASESQIAELGEQIGRRRQRILHTENINKTGFGNQRDCFTVSLDIQGITYLANERFRTFGGLGGNLLHIVPWIQIEPGQWVERHLMFGGRMPQYIAQFTVSAEAELAGKPDYRGLADMGDIRHLADSQIGGFFGMLTNVLCHGALRRAQRRIHMVDALEYSHRGLHSNTPVF